MQIVIPDRPDMAIRSCGALEEAAPKRIAYYDEKISVYVVVEKLIRSKLCLELSYTATRQTTYKASTPTFVDEATGQAVYRFDVVIVPGKSNNQMRVRACYEETAKPDVAQLDLEDYTRAETIDMCGVEIVKVSSRKEDGKDAKDEEDEEEEEEETSLPSCSTMLGISPLFQMTFKTVKSEKVLTSLELFASKRLAQYKTSIQVNSVAVQIANCEVSEFSDVHYPLELVQGSLLVLVYKLVTSDGKHIKPIVALINSTVDGFKKITTRWTTNVDFNGRNSMTATPFRVFSTPLLPSPPVQSPRSSSLFFSQSRRSPYRYKSGSTLNLANTNSSMLKRGLVVSVSGQTQAKLGEPFKWNLQLINKSDDKMDLILYVQSSIKKQYERTILPVPIHNTSTSAEDPIPLFTNAQLVRAFHHRFNKVGLVSMTNNLRMNLEPGNMFETEIELIGIERGLFNLHDVKILDVGSGDTFDCPKLLDVSVV